MPPIDTQVIPRTEHPGEGIQWDNIRLFLVVAKLGSLRAAATETRLSVNALRRRVEALEHETNSVLFARSARGMVLTAEGEKVYVAAEAMMQQASVLSRMSRREEPGLRSTVTIGVTEGLGTFWLIPRIVNLLAKEPKIQVNLRCEMAAPNISGLAVDVAIQLQRPTSPDLIVTRLGWLHICLFAAERYVAKFGAPANRAEITSHPFIELVAEQIASEKFEEQVSKDDKRAFVGLRVNTSSAQVLAATYGAGVTALPSYARALTSHLVHVSKDVHFTRDIWLAFHPRAGALPHVKRVIKWVKKSFDPVIYPWFQEEFITPDALPKLSSNSQDELFARFDGMMSK